MVTCLLLNSAEVYSEHSPDRKSRDLLGPHINPVFCLSSVELDFKQQEDKLQPVLRKLHPVEETQVIPSPYTQETHSSTPKQKSKTESKKHGRWKLWFL